MVGTASERDSLVELRGWLTSDGRVGRTVLMPTRAVGKAPLHKHRATASNKAGWGWEEADEYMRVNGAHMSWGLLLDGLVAVDCDDAASISWLEGLGLADAEIGAALARCAVQETRKGRHYLFYRPAWADAEGFFDGARQAPGGHAVDVKTRCSTGTRGVLAVEPSKDKKWVAGRAPWEIGELPEIPRILMEKVAGAEGEGEGARASEEEP
jgi:hypothetical protein